MVSKILKNFVTILFFVIGFTLISESMANAEGDTCHRNADNKIVLDDTSDTPVSHDSGSTYDKDYCNEEPLNYKIKIFEAMVCSSDPYVAGTGDTGADPDFTSCTNFFTNTAGKDVVVQPNAKADLFDGSSVSLPIGTFPYSVIILSNELNIKHYETYIDTGGNDADIRGYKASGFSTGKTCYSHGKTTTYTGYASDTVHGKTISGPEAGTGSSLGLICTDSFDPDNPPSDYDYTTEIIDSIDATCDSSNDCDTTFRPYIAYQNSSDINGRYAGVLVQNDGRTVGTNRNNSTRIAYLMNFNNSIEITEDITNFEMQFNTKTSVSIDWGAAASVTNAIKLGADPFQVKYIVTN